ncbi:MAG: prepilin-type N-terminal cleavage/methylation domain-containing protein [Acidobacteriia bacterium]|nr:prepilin-type N-terminal cleavage/methylation domain-containing protein [Terriglobia bacterium]
MEHQSGRRNSATDAVGDELATGARRSAHKGFTLIELLITIAIILTLCAIAIPNLLAAVNQARIAKAIGDIRSIGDDIEAYNVIHYQYPESLADIGRDTFPDPWGNPYRYLNFASASGKGGMRKDRFLVPINTYFDLYSMGKDGKSVPPLTAQASQDDVLWANDGGFIGLASQY